MGSLSITPGKAAAESPAPKGAVLELLRSLERQLPKGGGSEIAAAVAELVRRLREPLPAAIVDETVDIALAICRALYASSRSSEALPLARAALCHAETSRDRARTRRAATACGLLSSDTADLVGAIEHHVRALRLATLDEDRVEMSRIWNNIGAATGISGNHEMAARCYRRSLALVEGEAGPLFSRYAACANLADCLFQLGEIESGLDFAQRALREMSAAFRDQDPYGAILLRRNLVRLLVAAGRTAQAEVHVRETTALAALSPSPRVRIAADTTRASFELATGHTDIALTRLRHALAQAREVPATLQDTLACAIRGEEAAGNAARALIRLEELSDHIYRSGIERARAHVEFASLQDDPMSTGEHQREQARARLISKLLPPAQPEGWKALQRLGASAALRMESSGWHGVRVGALTKALALASGCDPLQALEIGLAAELHDIGMMSVPAGILSKRGPLNASEQAIVRRHPDAGAEVLNDDWHPRMLMAREIAKYHHAHWDGSGYPERVGGEFIPLGARMCAIADAYDMMVCGYGSRKPRTMGEALDELQREAGRHFDPALVDDFEAMIRSESEGRGVDLSSSAGMEDFQELILSLKEDRGFV